MLKKLVTAFFVSMMAFQAWGETVYIMDTIYVPLRTGKGIQYRIIEDAMASGYRLNRIREEEDDNGNSWSLVETQKGNQGWLQSQYLQNQAVAKDRLAAAQQQLAALQQQQQSSGGQISDLELRNAQLTEELQSARNQIGSLTEELDTIKRISADAVNIDRRNQSLIEEREKLKTRVDVLENRNQQLSDDSNQTWFLYGAIAVGIGCLLTLIVQKVRIKRRHSEWA